ncbi:coiled-coil-helix-coiled-coil-helix domain containing 3 isoform X1 [Rhodnius prolixus]|uniref:Head-elevated expression protein n=2 Tax=Rhodnius TaxID=13248 RepID=R4G424_RHOPR
MGGQHSTQRISIDNEGDPASVIKVSESVVDRLKGGTDQTMEKEEEEISKPNVRNYGLTHFHHVAVPENLPIQGLPYITSKDIQQVLEKEIQKNNEYWEKRIGELQKTHEQMDKIMEEEYLKATEEIKKILPKVRPANAKLPCQGGRSDVTKCYKSHPQQPLNCAAEVEQFANCLTNTRIKLQDEDKI